MTGQAADLPGIPVLRAADFERVRSAIYQHCGIELRGKEMLVASRLAKLLREAGVDTFQEYFEQIRRDSTGAALTAMVDALTTNHTCFFREPQHFSFLREVILPEFKSGPSIRIWSAACSTGEEPYSIAFVLREELGKQAAQARILATDLSTRVLEKARRAVYPASRFEGVPKEQMRKHLLHDGHDRYMVKEEARALIEFERMNLMDDLSRAGRFHVIFCRNVMIYFDKPTQQCLVRRLAAQLEAGGYLLTGHTEGLNGMEHGLEYVGPATYRKAPARSGTYRKGF